MLNAPKIHIIHSPATPIEIVDAPSIYAPNGTCYLMINPDDSDFLKMAMTMHQNEKQKNDWIRKYHRLMDGLKYWRNRALEHENRFNDIKT